MLVTESQISSGGGDFVGESSCALGAMVLQRGGFQGKIVAKVHLGHLDVQLRHGIPTVRGAVNAACMGGSKRESFVQQE